jgi:hypothetical protein
MDDARSAQYEVLPEIRVLHMTGSLKSAFAFSDNCPP